jgi:transcriptional regulator with XRE-family HTH domain
MAQREKPKESRELQQVKMELAAAHGAGEAVLLRQVALRYPAQLEKLTDFVAGLYATDLDEQEATLPVTGEIEALTLRARQRALSAVFSTAPAAQPAAAPVSTLAQVRKASGLSLVELARRLTLGADVVQKLEQGRIIAASVPQRLTDRLAEVLSLSKEQIWTMLRSAPGMELQPALLRRRPIGKNSQPEGQPAQPQTFAEAVQHSPSMAPEQRALWLEEDSKS